MLEEKGFPVIVTSQKYDSNTVILTLKFESKEVDQKFLNDIAEQLDSPNIVSCFGIPAWSKISFNINEKVNVELDGALKFKATIDSVNITKKQIEDGNNYIYSIKIIKDIEPNIDSVIGVEYLKRKEVNEDGKTVYVLFNLKMNIE